MREREGGREARGRRKAGRKERGGKGGERREEKEGRDRKLVPCACQHWWQGRGGKAFLTFLVHW